MIETLNDKIQALGLEGSNWEQIYTPDQIMAFDVATEQQYHSAIDVMAEWERVTGNPDSDPIKEAQAEAVHAALVAIFGEAQFDNFIEGTRFII